MNYQPLNPINLDSLRWAQEKQLLELHRELTRHRQRIYSEYSDVTREYATLEFQIAEIEDVLRRLGDGNGDC